MSMRSALAAAALAFAAGTAHAQATLQLDVNDDAARLGFSNRANGTSVGGLEVGGSILHNQDTGDVGTLGLHVSGDAGSRTVPVSASVGASAYGVNLDNSNLDAAALALGGELRLTPPRQNRLGFAVNLHYAPEVLSFMDSESLIEYGAEISYQLLRQAEVFVGYRQIEVDYDVVDNVEVDDGGIVGFRLNF